MTARMSWPKGRGGRRDALNLLPQTQPVLPRERIKVAGGGELSTVDHVTKDSPQSLRRLLLGFFIIWRETTLTWGLQTPMTFSFTRSARQGKA